MKHFGRALLLLTLGLVLMSQVAMAQDALSAILPAPEGTRVGSQLLYVFEDGAPSGRGLFKSFLTITNTNITAGVWVHFQYYSTSQTGGCTELFDYYDFLTQGKRLAIDPAAVRKVNGQLVGIATDGRFLLMATALNSLIVPPAIPNFPADLRAHSFNWLTGQLWVSQFSGGKTATYMTNAIPREAVDVNGGPAADYQPIDGTTYHLQYFRPFLLIVNSFFPTKVGSPGAVHDGVPFGNRLTFFTWSDQYTNSQNMYRIQSGAATLQAFVFDDNEAAYSVTPQTIACVREFTIAPTPASGNFTDFIGSALNSAVNSTGGWMRMRVVLGTTAYTNIVGWFSQGLISFGGGDLLIGEGRQGMTAAGAAATSGGLTINTSSGGTFASGGQTPK